MTWVGAISREESLQIQQEQKWDIYKNQILFYNQMNEIFLELKQMGFGLENRGI